MDPRDHDQAAAELRAERPRRLGGQGALAVAFDLDPLRLPVEEREGADVFRAARDPQQEVGPDPFEPEFDRVPVFGPSTPSRSVTTSSGPTASP